MSLKLTSLNVTDATVECIFEDNTGRAVRGAIEEAFFAEFAPQPQQLSPQRKERIVKDNVDYLTSEVERQLRLGYRQISIQ